MQKNLNKDETDLGDLIITIWNKKFQVAIFILISISIVFFFEKNQKQEKLIVNAMAEIRPVSVYDQALYEIFNLAINSGIPKYFSERINKVDNDDKDYKISNLKKPKFQISMKTISMKEIDRDFLLDLFIDKFEDKTYLISLIKKSNYINQENYSSKIEYEKAVTDIASSIEILKDKKNNKIFILSNDVNEDKWEIFLKFLEKKNNIEIKKNLNEIFNNYLNYLKLMHNFIIQDIKTELSITKNEQEKKRLEEEINIQSANNFISRTKYLFDSSPMSNNNKFYAAKIDYTQIENQINNNKKSNLHKFIVAGICGAIFGIFFVLISTSIQNRR